MKKKLALLTILVFLSNICFSQFSGVKYQKHSDLSSTKTLVVLFGDESTHIELKASIDSLWKITEYSFISLEEVKGNIKKEGHSMLLPIKIKDEEGTHTYYSLIFTGSKLRSYKREKLLAYMLLENDEVYRFDNIIQNLQLTMDIMKAEKIDGKPNDITKKLCEHYNKNMNELKEGKLYINKNSFKKNFNKLELRQVYPYSYSICDNNKIKQLIKDRTEDSYYLVNDLNQKVIYEASSGRIIYCEVSATGKYYLNNKYFKKLVKKISK